jgi:hypothetical protein
MKLTSHPNSPPSPETLNSSKPGAQAYMCGMNGMMCEPHKV